MSKQISFSTQIYERRKSFYVKANFFFNPNLRASKIVLMSKHFSKSKFTCDENRLNVKANFFFNPNLRASKIVLMSKRFF